MPIGREKLPASGLSTGLLSLSGKLLTRFSSRFPQL
jgi:hypothetical protein